MRDTRNPPHRTQTWEAPSRSKRRCGTRGSVAHLRVLGPTDYACGRNFPRQAKASFSTNDPAAHGLRRCRACEKALQIAAGTARSALAVQAEEPDHA